MVILPETWQNEAVSSKINRFRRKEKGRWKEGGKRVGHSELQGRKRLEKEET